MAQNARIIIQLYVQLYNYTDLVPQSQLWALTCFVTMIPELSSSAGLRVLVASAVVPCFSLTTLNFPSCFSPAAEFCANALWMVPEYTIAWVQDGEHFIIIIWLHEWGADKVLPS